jgi:glycerol-3-phosphate acyltransferase PlsY
MPVNLLAVVCIAYLLGSVPFALILARIWGSTDPRAVGSRNPGAANVLRTAGLTAAGSVALLDAIKGAAGVLIAQRFGGAGAAPEMAGLAAIVGHIYPVWLRFRGGKGVATTCGVFAVLTPTALPPAVVLFLAGVWLTNYVSMGSVLASLALPPLTYVAGSPLSSVAAALAAAALVVFRHRSNLARVLAGTEPAFGVRLPPPDAGRPVHPSASPDHESQVANPREP